MQKCGSCGVDFPEDFFSPTEGGQMYEHLHLARVCRRCQSIPKKCTKCHEVYPGLKKYFHPKQRGKHGLNSRCRGCVNQHNLDRHHDPILHEGNLQRMREYNTAHK